MATIDDFDVGPIEKADDVHSFDEMAGYRLGAKSKDGTLSISVEALSDQKGDSRAGYIVNKPGIVSAELETVNDTIKLEVNMKSISYMWPGDIHDDLWASVVVAGDEQGKVTIRGGYYEISGTSFDDPSFREQLGDAIGEKKVEAAIKAMQFHLQLGKETVVEYQQTLQALEQHVATKIRQPETQAINAIALLATSLGELSENLGSAFKRAKIDAREKETGTGQALS